MSKYPRDEFDRTPEFTDRKGVHRDQPAVKGGSTGLGLLMGVGILALVVGLVSFLVLPRIVGTGSAAAAAQTTAAASQTPAASSSSEPAESAAESESADASEPAAAASSSASTTPGATATEEPAGTATVDYAANVGVYNGSGISGLAGTGLAKLQGSGFSSLTAGNWTKKTDASVVYYKSEASRATAQEAARLLGISTVYQTANIPVEISVVLGRTYG